MSAVTPDRLFGILLGGVLWPEPPDTVPLRVLGLSARPASREQVRSAFRARLAVVHPDVAAVADQAAVAELMWARDVLLAKIPPPHAVTAGNADHGDLYQPSRGPACKGCGEVPGHGRIRRGRWRGYCWRCKRDGENARARELRQMMRADRACDTCGQLFTPPRADACYCSPACRQRAYRKRQAVAS